MFVCLYSAFFLVDFDIIITLYYFVMYVTLLLLIIDYVLNQNTFYAIKSEFLFIHIHDVITKRTSKLSHQIYNLDVFV